MIRESLYSKTKNKCTCFHKHHHRLDHEFDFIRVLRILPFCTDPPHNIVSHSNYLIINLETANIWTNLASSTVYLSSTSPYIHREKHLSTIHIIIMGITIILSKDVWAIVFIIFPFWYLRRHHVFFFPSTFFLSCTHTKLGQLILFFLSFEKSCFSFNLKTIPLKSYSSVYREGQVLQCLFPSQCFFLSLLNNVFVCIQISFHTCK